MAKRIAYLGPAGTFTEEAALRYDAKAELVPFSSILAVAAAVDSGIADEGVVPIENSIEGSVTDTLDLLIHESRLLIWKELVLPIEHYLLVKAGAKAEEIDTIFAHPQSLGQCRRFLERCFPKAQVIAALSTAAAVQDMMAFSSSSATAIGTKRAADLYGAEVLARGIQDQASNVTRFVVLSPTDHPPTGSDKTSLCFSTAEDRPGILCSILQEFAQRKINLAKIESRPTKESLGNYIFLVDLEGHRDDAVVAEALEKVRTKTALFKLLGSYPRYTEKSKNGA
jgi:prephenate dehydratase